MKLSEDGAAAIRAYEGCVLKAYRCPAWVWTIGYGHTGPEVVEDVRWTKQKAIEVFALDVAKFEATVMQSLNETAQQRLTQWQFDAMVSLAYNIGSAAFRKSTLAKKLNAGDVPGAACQFVVWNKIGGVTNAGLLLRRASELFRFAGGYE